MRPEQSLSASVVEQRAAFSSAPFSKVPEVFKERSVGYNPLGAPKLASACSQFASRVVGFISRAKSVNTVASLFERPVFLAANFHVAKTRKSGAITNWIKLLAVLREEGVKENFALVRKMSVFAVALEGFGQKNILGRMMEELFKGMTKSAKEEQVESLKAIATQKYKELTDAEVKAVKELRSIDLVEEEKSDEPEKTLLGGFMSQKLSSSLKIHLSYVEKVVAVIRDAEVSSEFAELLDDPATAIRLIACCDEEGKKAFATVLQGFVTKADSVSKEHEGALYLILKSLLSAEEITKVAEDLGLEAEARAALDAEYDKMASGYCTIL